MNIQENSKVKVTSESGGRWTIDENNDKIGEINYQDKINTLKFD